MDIGFEHASQIQKVTAGFVASLSVSIYSSDKYAI
jgi:hypothetical protein